MNILALKLILAPLIIGSASLAGRRWGPAVSGWIVGMPLTSGPVVFFVALSHGALFAESSALGVLSGGISLVLFTRSPTHGLPHVFNGTYPLRGASLSFR